MKTKIISWILLCMLIIVGFLGSTQKASAETPLLDDLDYFIERNTWYKLERKIHIDDDNNSDNGPPDFYPGIHGVRISGKGYLEMPVNIYMMVDKDGYVCWKVEYAKVRDIEFSAHQRHVSKRKITCTEEFIYKAGKNKENKIVCKLDHEGKNFVFYALVDIDETTAKQLGKDVEPGIYAVEINRFNTGYASKARGTIEFTSENNDTVYVLIKK